jgi:hypothetical protein
LFVSVVVSNNSDPLGTIGLSSFKFVHLFS